MIYAMHKTTGFRERKEEMEKEIDCQKKIKELRESTGMSRKAFCDYFRIPYSTVTDWERGHRNAPDYVLRLLEYYIRVNLLKEDSKPLEFDGVKGEDERED